MSAAVSIHGALKSLIENKSHFHKTSDSAVVYFFSDVLHQGSVTMNLFL